MTAKQLTIFVPLHTFNNITLNMAGRATEIW